MVIRMTGRRQVSTKVRSIIKYYTLKLLVTGKMKNNTCKGSVEMMHRILSAMRVFNKENLKILKENFAVEAW